MRTDPGLTVLGRSTSSNVQKVMWLLGEIDRESVRVDVGGVFGGNHDAAYLLKNPNGVVPTLIHGDHVVWESNTILRYLANVFGASSFYPADPAGRAGVERWMDWQLSTLGPANTLLYQSIVRTPPEQRASELIEPHRARNAALFLMLDQALSSQRFIAGDGFTLADISIGALAHRWFRLPIARPHYAHLQRWYEEMCGRAPFHKHIVSIEFA
ncbi:glutathione S-transferase [Paraburkholderia xenovorans]|uniref:glutathione S-transferase family protein n=1 Tax=Paraburkholderia xenovorans TaxID=36873 RepID=UPI0038BA3849